MVKLIIYIAFAVFGALLMAQPETFAERGFVRAQSRPVPGATVIAERGAEKISTSTGDDGGYELSLPAGDWKITVEMFGFAISTQTLHPGPSAPPMEWTLILRQAPARGQLAAPAVKPDSNDADPSLADGA